MDDKESLDQLISRGEGERLEFKAAVPTSQHLAREISAFANSSGGTILLSVREDGGTPGIFVSESRRALRDAIELLTPKPEASLGAVGAAELERSLA